MNRVNEHTEKLMVKVQDSPKYLNFDKSLVVKLVEEAQNKYKKDSLIIKSVRTILHQIGGAYLGNKLDYVKLNKELDQLPSDIEEEQSISFCRKTMLLHTSTAERMSFIEEFFGVIFQHIGPISSIADLGCGFTPLAYALMPVNKDAMYHAYDIYTDMIEFLNHFFNHFSLNGHAMTCDISQPFDMAPVQLALLLKTMPLMEQLSKQIGSDLITRIQAEHILVSFPIKSMGGYSKGMRKHYSIYFDSVIDKNLFSIKEFEFSNELAYLLTRNK